MTKAAPTKTAPVKKSAPKKTATAKAAAPAKAEKYTLKQLGEDLSHKLPLVSRGTIDKVVEATFSQMTSAFLDGKAVIIKDFGKLEVKHRPERQGRNPATGESITIPPKTVPKFTFAKSLKQAAL
jgi:DNA-binding protein HU-beta